MSFKGCYEAIKAGFPGFYKLDELLSYKSWLLRHTAFVLELLQRILNWLQSLHTLFNVWRLGKVSFPQQLGLSLADFIKAEHLWSLV